MKTGVKKAPEKHGERAARFERGTRNVFADLELPDAAALLAKAELVSRISDIIRMRGLTQAEAARILGIQQPKVSALMRGALDGFSTDRLFRFLNALGSDVEIAVRPRLRSSKRARIRVVRQKLAG